MDVTALDKLLLSTFSVGLVLGAVLSKTNFCTMGAVSDWMNMGATGRLWSWLFAISIALFGVLILQQQGIDLSATLPPYRTPEFSWLRYLCGGGLFGIGMTLAGGCGNKTLLNIGNGNLKSLVVAILIAISAFFMTKSDLYAIAFQPWLSASSISLSKHNIPSQEIVQFLLPWIPYQNLQVARWSVGGGLAGLLFMFALRSADFRSDHHYWLSGLTLGLAVTSGWWLSAGPLGQQAMEDVQWMDQIPASVGAQSFTFINPMGEAYLYLSSNANPLLLTFGVVSIGGVLLGAFFISILTGRFHFTWFQSWGDLLRHSFGGVLMGVGGVLAMGCTIGQGVTGISTLALGSFLALGSIVLGSIVTIKFLDYQIQREDQNKGVLETQ